MYKWIFIYLLISIFVNVTDADSEKLNRDPFASANNSSAMMTACPTSENFSPLHEMWVPLFFAKAGEIAQFVSNPSNAFLSSRGKIHADIFSNQLWIQDDKTHLFHIKKIIQHLDQSQPQFLIKAKILVLDREYENTLGVQFNTRDSSSLSTNQLSMDLPKTADNDRSFTFVVAKLASNQLLNLQLSALEQEGHASLIANPSLITLNKKTASIESGAEVPYEEATASGATNIDFKKAVLRLKVTPQLIDHRRIVLHISLNEDKVSPITVKGVPAIQTQQITTEVIADNNQTIALGGILEDNRAKQILELPIVGKIPIIGRLFRRHQQLSEQQTLLIFLTPMIIKEAGALATA